MHADCNQCVFNVPGDGSNGLQYIIYVLAPSPTSFNVSVYNGTL